MGLWPMPMQGGHQTLVGLFDQDHAAVTADMSALMVNGDLFTSNLLKMQVGLAFFCNSPFQNAHSAHIPRPEE